MSKMGRLLRTFYNKNKPGYDAPVVSKGWRKGDIGVGRYPDESCNGWFRFQVVRAAPGEVKCRLRLGQ